MSVYRLVHSVLEAIVVLSNFCDSKYHSNCIVYAALHVRCCIFVSWVRYFRIRCVNIDLVSDFVSGTAFYLCLFVILKACDMS